MENIKTQNKSMQFKEKQIWFLDHEVRFMESLRIDLDEHGFIKENTIITPDQKLVYQEAVSGKIDILVSDFKMPEKDGITFLEEIRKKNSDIILVLYTGYTISPNNIQTIRYKNSRIYYLNKLSGFSELFCNLYLYYQDSIENFSNKFSENSTNLTKRKTIQDTKTEIPLIDKTIPDINTEIWTKTHILPARILKVSKNDVDCECLIDEQSDTYQIRKFPIILFKHLKEIKVGFFVNIQISQIPGSIRTDIIEDVHSEIKEKFNITDGWKDLENFEMDKPF